MQYELTENNYGTIDFFPKGFDKINLVNISTVSDRFSKYINVKYGNIVDCESFYNNYLHELKEEE